MANAKKCDICGGYYDVPEIDEDHIFNTNINTSMVRLLRMNSPRHKEKHAVMQFDSCENCLQDVLDYILTKRAKAEEVTE
jgi:hypothetical protein